MSEGRVERRLAAILAADVVGYSRLMGLDEAGTLARLKALRRDLIDPKVVDHKGRIVKTTGDGILIEFPSVVEAVACAVAVQRGMAGHNVSVPQGRRIEFRIGINTGDVIVEDGDIHGDGVNIAARLEALAEPGGICISAMVHDQVQGRVEVGFEDTGEQSLKNIARPIRVYRLRQDGSAATATQLATNLTPPDKPSIAVLPFQNMSGDPEQEHLADGMAEEIITALSHIRWLSVIARNSSFAYKGQALNAKQVARELGVRYVLEGSVRKGGARARITAQLIEAETGAHLWADHFDGSIEDIIDLQDQVAAGVAGGVDPALEAAETARSAQQHTTAHTAYDLSRRAYAMVFSSSKNVPEALRLYEQAIAREPRYAPALAGAALCCWRLMFDSRSEDRAADRLKGMDFARGAMEVADNDPVILGRTACALAYFGEDIGAMIAVVEHALALNPNYARNWFNAGQLRLWAAPPRHLYRICRKGTATQSSRKHWCNKPFDRSRAPSRPAI